jgi:hypothetical protein
MKAFEVFVRVGEHIEIIYTPTGPDVAREFHAIAWVRSAGP